MSHLAEPYDATRDWEGVDKPQLYSDDLPSSHRCYLCNKVCEESTMTHVAFDNVQEEKFPVCEECLSTLEAQ